MYNTQHRLLIINVFCNWKELTIFITTTFFSFFSFLRKEMIKINSSTWGVAMMFLGRIRYDRNWLIFVKIYKLAWGKHLQVGFFIISVEVNKFGQRKSHPFPIQYFLLHTFVLFIINLRLIIQLRLIITMVATIFWVDGFAKCSLYVAFKLLLTLYGFMRNVFCIETFVSKCCLNYRWETKCFLLFLLLPFAGEKNLLLKCEVKQW